jgi:hypothetical protein
MAYEKVDPSEVPEVAAFIEADEVLNTFMEAHKDVFETFRMLVDDRNTKRQSADKMVRATQVLCGPWQQQAKKTLIDVEMLYDRLGRDEFLAVGGSIETKPHYSMDKKRLEQAIATNRVPAEVALDAIKPVVSYHAPKDIVL